MRFHYGPLPENPEFRPEAGGWHKLREPSVTVFTWIAGFVGFALFLATIWAWVGLAGVELNFSVSVRPGEEASWAFASLVLQFLGGVALLILVHELLHAAIYPNFGFDRRTFLGAWPSKGLFYAYFDGELSRNRFVVTLLTPFLVLTIGLLVFEVLVRTDSAWLPGWSILNAAFAGGDITATLLVVVQVPSRAIVRNQGWQTWWRTAGEAAGEL
ncbi:MAG: DUF3267 domain-containing protein [Pirellulaceae bacterium]|nr:DUF3267 domain-containing protein [Pirellulaceae bacterium]